MKEEHLFENLTAIHAAGVPGTVPRYEGTGALLRKLRGVRLLAYKHKKMTVYPRFDLSS